MFFMILLLLVLMWKFDVDNLLIIKWILVYIIAHTYKKTYNENIIFNNKSYVWDESLSKLSHSIGWFTCEFSVYVGCK